MSKICGVYKITNAVNGKFYIGSSNNIKNRWYQHKKSLNEGIHGNIHLQNAWNKYGGQNFVFEILEECNPQHQFEREQFYLNNLNPFDNNGYNIVRQISKEHMSDNYMIKHCDRCSNQYYTFSHLSKYCDTCKEEMAKENIPMHMSDWIKVLDEFLRFNRKDLLEGAGKISNAIAKQKALKEYEIYDNNRIEQLKILELTDIEENE